MCQTTSACLFATTWPRRASIGRSRNVHAGFSAAPSIPTPPAMPWCNRARCLPPEPLLTTTISAWCLGQQFNFSPSWFGSLVLNASALHLTQARNVNLGFAYAFPFTITSSTISGYETYGDNLFVTPITAFPDLAQSGKISAALRRYPHRRQPHAAVRRQLHPRTGAERRT